MALERKTGAVSTYARSPNLDAAAIEVVVTTPTFRRPEHLMRTLDSITNQTVTANVAIIVIENDAEQRQGAMAAGPHFEKGRYNGLVVIAHERGNCHAYNAGWHTALALFPNLKHIAVIDDDECADDTWLEALIQTQNQFNADFVGGPQIPVFEGSPPLNWTRHPVFTPHYDTTGPVEILYSSGNVLINADVLAAMPKPYLDLAFNFTGGGDADFMRRAKKRGFSFAWCNHAIVHETIPESRVTRQWITKRALRNGQLSALIERRARAHQRFAHARTLAKSLALAAASIPRAFTGLIRTGSILAALYPIHIAAGRIASEFGYANEQYRNPQD